MSLSDKYPAAAVAAAAASTLVVAAALAYYLLAPAKPVLRPRSLKLPAPPHLQPDPSLDSPSLASPGAAAASFPDPIQGQSQIPVSIIDKHLTDFTVRDKVLRGVFISHKFKSDVPAIIFVHGMGGQMEQFVFQIEHFSTVANVAAYDMVGNGQSAATLRDEDYTTDSLVDDLVALVQLIQTQHSIGSFVLVCHSYGCAIATKASQRLESLLKAIVFIAPKALHTEHDQARVNSFVSTSTPLIEVFRWRDRYGGINSQSVNRYVAPSAPTVVREFQLKWNASVKTTTAKRYYKGINWVTPNDYGEIKAPLLLISGQHDKAVPANSAAVIKEHATGSSCVSDLFVVPNVGHSVMFESPNIVNAIVYKFLTDVGLKEISLRDQILKETEGVPKWGLKNYQKWKRITPVATTAVRGSFFRPMKVLKEDDDEHTPVAFATSNPEIGLVIDISLDHPPYEPENLVKSGCQYHKLSTVSKIPPSQGNVNDFKAVVDGFWAENPDRHIAVHCHYGFNRTGFLICCYLIECKGFSVADAIQAFADARPPGIRHMHFKDELFYRYVVSDSLRQAQGDPKSN
ncbi:Alpha/Beta hydrolase protein [Polychytrium aggregatum]|uniref:Alpha/Beta hydrolase protein n=1 Tax=Polychytrium aggregatum TaxID=110093 RepID=UPI0022FE4821|nr:Alpha/Beta hydrolase protein [Polychytrium aggregatum]KAI9207915.1 Alpha/Beta hydrolase protein [Polychytrium aggregatum]